MRHCKYINGTRLVYDGQFRCPFVVIGQRSEEHAIKSLPPKPDPLKPVPAKDRTPEFYETQKAWASHAIARAGGRFAVGAIEWCEDEAEAAAIVAKFTAPEWINLSVQPVDTIIG